MIFIQQSKKGDFMLNNLGKGLLAVSLLAGFIGCTKGKVAEDSTSGGSSSTLTIAGTMSVLQSGSSTNLAIMSKSTDGRARWRALTDYRLACATFETIPSACGGAVGSDGSFSVSCDGFAEKPFGCFIYHTTTFESYDMVFNVEGEENQVMTAGAGTMSATINIDTETGLAQTEVELPTESAPVTAPAVDVTDVSVFDGIFYLGPAPYSAVSSKFTTVDQSALRAEVEFWTQSPPCPTGSTADQQNPNKCTWTPATAAQGYNFYACRMTSHDESQCVTDAIAGTVQFPTTTQIANGMGMPVYFKSSEDANQKPFLSVWPSQANYQACGSDDHTPVWKISDGAGGQADVSLSLGTSSSTGAQVLTSLSGALSTAINQWFPILNALDSNGNNYTVQSSDVSCKFAYALPMEYHNNTPTQLAACEADTNGCATYTSNGNYFDALWKYKQKKLYDGATISANDSIFGNTAQINFANHIVNASAVTVAAGVWDGWNQQTQQPIIAPATGAQMMDIGGCISWGDGSQNSQPSVVEVGKYYQMWNGQEYIYEKCRFSERRLLVAGTAQQGAWLDLAGDNSTQLYREAFPTISWDHDSDANTDDKVEIVWGQTCGINADGNAGVDFIEQYPHDETAANIASHFNDRMNGGSQQDRDGLKLRVMMNLLNSKDGRMQVDSSRNFHFYNQNTNQGGQISCTELANPADIADNGNATDAFNKMGEIVHSSHDYDMAQAMACFLSGVGNGNYESVDFTAFDSLDSPGERQAYADCDDQNNDSDCNDDGEKNNVPDIIENVAANSCLPQVQVTRICNEQGCGEARPLCTDFTADNGGCHKASPISRMALMKVAQLDTGKFSFFQKDEWYDFQYDHRTNTSRQCTRMNMMTISNEVAVTATPSSGDAVVMMFNEKESELCEGEEAEVSPARKQFMYFVK